MALNQVDPDELDRYVWAIHQGECPKCHGPGPVDVHSSHWVWSAIVLTSWKTTNSVCCRRCAKKEQGVALLSSFLLGWWGVPMGLVMTPVQVGTNLCALLGWAGPSLERPSAALTEYARATVGAQLPADQEAARIEAKWKALRERHGDLRA